MSIFSCWTIGQTEPGWVPPAPQLPGLELVFQGPVEDFVQKVMSQHYVIAYGDHRIVQWG